LSAHRTASVRAADERSIVGRHRSTGVLLFQSPRFVVHERHL
jgi:hypothetical protein